MTNFMNREPTNNRLIFEQMPIPEALATLAIPTIIGQLIVLIYSLADTFFIGRTGNPYMVAAASLILPVFNICVPISNLFSTGGGTLISRLLGVGRDREAKSVSAFSFYAAALSGLLYAGIFLIFMDRLLTGLGASPETLPYARQYAFCVIVIGAVPTVIQMTMAGLLRSVGCARQAGFGVSMGGILNIALDPLFMFVLLPKGMETMGAGLATMLSNVVCCIYFGFVFRKLRGTTVLTLDPRIGLPARGNVAQVFTVGVPASLATLLFDIDYMVINKLMTGYGDIPLAAVGIVLKAERLPLNIGIGLCQGMIPIAAYNYSNGNFSRMKEALRTTRKAGLITGIVSLVLYECFAPQIMGLFIGNEETIRIGTEFLRIRSVATTFMFLCFHLVFFFQAIGNGRISLLLAVIRWAVFNIPMLFILNALIGMHGLVLTQVLADICTVIVSYIIYHRTMKTLGPAVTGF